MTEKKFNKYDFKISSVCHCDCHIEGKIIMHCSPCCDLTYRPYLTKEGKLEVAKYIKLKE